MINNISIDAEFQNLIRPLSDQERAELRDSLSRCGLLSPLIIWNNEGKNILVDGHNRLSLWKEFNGFNDEYELKTQELRFGNRDKVKEWIIKNQLGRRNLSPDDYTLLVGMLYHQRKKSVSNPDGIGGKSGKIVKGQNGTQQSTAEQVAEETGVSPRTVKRAAKLAAKVEEIHQAEPELPRQEVITKAKEIIAEAAPKSEPPKRSLDEMLAERWNRFIKDIPVTDHTAVRLWVTAKLKEAAL
jgi:ParB-like chromosome segregation protein Spo0J